MIPYLRNCVGRGVHELCEVHHALPLVLGDVDALNGGETGVGVPEVLQLELPLGETGPGQLHKHLPRHTNTDSLSPTAWRLKIPWGQHYHLVLQEDDELRSQDEAAEFRRLRAETQTREKLMRRWSDLWKGWVWLSGTSSFPETCTTTGKPLWLVDVLLRMSTMVPTFSILFRQVTGELITSLEGQKKSTEWTLTSPAGPNW